MENKEKKETREEIKQKIKDLIPSLFNVDFDGYMGNGYVKLEKLKQILTEIETLRECG